MLKADKERPLRTHFTTATKMKEEVNLVEDEEEIKRQCLYEFKNQDGSLKTCESLQKLIDEEMIIHEMKPEIVERLRSIELSKKYFYCPIGEYVLRLTTS